MDSPRAKSKSLQSPLKLKPILCGFTVSLLLILLLRANFSSSSKKLSSIASSVSASEKNQDQEPTIPTCPTQEQQCNKLPQSISQALIHYATSTIVPQQTTNEISVPAQALLEKSPCNFLVFGLGHDSLLWSTLNHGGRTVFLEEDQSWINQMTSKHPSLESYQIQYDTKVSEANDLLALQGTKNCTVVIDPRLSECKLGLKNLPDEIYDVEWDLIMVDAPTGYFDEAPGRMKAIYTAGLMARNRRQGETDIYVHDIDRGVEDKFSRAFLCEGYLKNDEGRLRHFTIPSHRSRDVQFCT